MSIELIVVIWLLGLGLLLSELFVATIIPGVLGALLEAVAIGAMFVEHGPLWGGALLVASLVVGGVTVLAAVKRVTHRHELTTQSGFVGTDDRSHLVGLTGVAATMLRPGGWATIGGERVDVVTAGEMVQAGAELEVVAVEGNRVEVRAKEGP